MGVIEGSGFDSIFISSITIGDGDLERVFDRLVDSEGDFGRFLDLDLLLLFLRFRFFFLLDRDRDRVRDRRLLFFFRDLLLDHRRFFRERLREERLLFFFLERDGDLDLVRFLDLDLDLDFDNTFLCASSFM